MAKVNKKQGNKHKNVIPPKNITGYPEKKACNCPIETLGKTAGGGKRSEA